jgi:hypothetical protein
MMEYPNNHDRYQVGKCRPWHPSEDTFTLPLNHIYQGPVHGIIKSPEGDQVVGNLNAYHPTRGNAAKLTFIRDYVLNRAGALMENLDGRGAVEEAKAAWDYMLEVTKVD